MASEQTQDRGRWRKRISDAVLGSLRFSSNAITGFVMVVLVKSSYPAATCPCDSFLSVLKVADRVCGMECGSSCSTLIAAWVFTPLYLLRLFLNMEAVLAEMFAVWVRRLCTRVIGFASQASVLRYVDVEEAEEQERRANVPISMEQDT